MTIIKTLGRSGWDRQAASEHTTRAVHSAMTGAHALRMSCSDFIGSITT